MADTDILDYEDYIHDLEAKDDPASKAIFILLEWGPIDGGHHKQWVIDQALRNLLGKDYQRVINLFNGQYPIYAKWDEGIVP